MTELERIERARRAQMALDEFLAPAFAVVEADYTEKLVNAATSTDPRSPEMIARLAAGMKAARSAHNQIMALVMDGEITKAGMIKAERIGAMTEPDRRLLNIGPN